MLVWFYLLNHVWTWNLFLILMLPLVFLTFTFISDCLFYYRYAILFLFDFELFCSLKENKPFLNFDFYLERHYTKRRFIASSLIHVRKWTCTTWHVHIEFIGSVKGSLSLVKKSPGEKSENLKIKILCLYGNLTCSMVVFTLARNYKVCDLIHSGYNLFCSINIINL